MNITQTPQHTPHTELDLQKMDQRGFRFELIKGDLEPMSPTSFAHGTISNRFSYFVNAYVFDQGIGDCTSAETGFIISRNPDTVLAPDFAYVSNAKLAHISRSGYGDVVPDLVLETRSPSDSPVTVAAKIILWLQAGVGMVIDIDPEQRTLIVHRSGREPLTLTPADMFNGEDVLPGFALPLHRLFREPAN